VALTSSPADGTFRTMRMRRTSRAVAVLGTVVGVAAVAPAADAASTTLLRLDGIGPLRLGMSRTAAVATGWLAGRTHGCPLGASPPVVHRLAGRNAPRGVRGSAEFERGRLRTLTAGHGVHTATGVTVGRTTTRQMVARYRRAGFAASVDSSPMFGVRVTVRRRGRVVIEGAARGRIVALLGVPAIPVCE